MSTHSDISLFLRQLVRRPTEISALAPSSEKLADAMAAQVSDRGGPVIELGPGTGKITQALLRHGVAEDRLNLIELNPEFIPILRARFPKAHIHQGKAQDMAALGLREVSAVVSGLPFLSLPNDFQRAILTASFDCLKKGGAFVQFTYGPVHPVASSVYDEMNLVATRTARVWGNLPPARVYTIRQQNG